MKLRLSLALTMCLSTVALARPSGVRATVAGLHFPQGTVGVISQCCDELPEQRCSEETQRVWCRHNEQGDLSCTPDRRDGDEYETVAVSFPDSDGSVIPTAGRVLHYDMFTPPGQFGGEAIPLESGLFGGPADYDRSGAINSKDFFDFTTDWLIGDADFDMSGETDSGDFWSYLDAFLGTQ